MATSLNSSAARILYERLVAVAAGAITTPVVRVHTGLGGYLIVNGANATAYSAHEGPLFYMEGDVEGNSTASGTGVPVLVSPLRIVENTAIAGLPVVGEALYLTDAGVVDNTPGTTSRRVGTVLAIPAPRSVTWLFDGSIGSSYFSETQYSLDALKGLSVLNGQLQIQVREVTIADGATGTARATDCMVAVLRSAVAGAARTLQLPSTPALGQWLIIKDADASAAASNIIIDGNGYLMDGDATATLNTAGISGSLVFSGTRWLRTALLV